MHYCIWFGLVWFVCVYVLSSCKSRKLTMARPSISIEPQSTVSKVLTRLSHDNAPDLSAQCDGLEGSSLSASIHMHAEFSLHDCAVLCCVVLCCVVLCCVVVWCVVLWWQQPFTQTPTPTTTKKTKKQKNTQTNNALSWLADWLARGGFG